MLQLMTSTSGQTQPISLQSKAYIYKILTDSSQQVETVPSEKVHVVPDVGLFKRFQSSQ